MDSRFFIVNQLEPIIKSLKNLDNYKKYCQEQLSQCDKNITDIEHAIEFSDELRLNCVEITKLTYKLREHRKERRTIKDELEILSAFETVHINTQQVCDELKRVKGVLETTQTKQSERKYMPRCLYELFGYSEDEKNEAEADKKCKKLLGKSANKKSMSLERAYRRI